MKSPRFGMSRYWTVVLLLAGTALLLQARGNTDLIPLSEPLLHFPRAIRDGREAIYRLTRKR